MTGGDWCVLPNARLFLFGPQHNLLKLMLSERPDERPTTIGIRARPPLGVGGSGSSSSSSTEWHFTLPPRRRDSHISGVSQNGSSTTTSSAGGQRTAGSHQQLD